MHGVLVTANIANGQFQAARKGLREEVIPRVRKAPSLVMGFWTKERGWWAGRLACGIRHAAAR